MNKSRLNELNTEEINAKLATVPYELLRQVVLDICVQSIRATDLRDRRIDEAIQQMRVGSYLTGRVLHNLEQCYDELDLLKLELNDNPDDASLHNLYPMDFKRARAACALLFCAKTHDRRDAEEAIYEATISLDENLTEIERVIDARLHPRIV